MLTTVLNALGTGWKTVTGALAWGFGHLVSTGIITILPPNIGHIVCVVGGILAALGLYHATVRQGT